MGFFSRRFSGLLLRLGASGPVALGAAAIASYLCLGAPGAAASETSAEAARSHLYAATLAGGADDLARLVAADSQDMEARFGLGMIQFVRAVEKLCQAQYRYGIQQPDPHILLPLLRFPIPPNPNPEAIDYDAFRAMLQDFIVDLATSEATLAGIGERPATVVVDLMQVRLNVTGAIKSGEGIRLIDLIAAISGQSGRWPPEATKALDVKFDSGDAAWLRAYTHALSALCEFLPRTRLPCLLRRGRAAFLGAPEDAIRGRTRRAGPSQHVDGFRITRHGARRPHRRYPPAQLAGRGA